jgi:hypothetical protein
MLTQQRAKFCYVMHGVALQYLSASNAGGTICITYEVRPTV